MFFVCILVQAHILQIYTFYIYRGTGCRKSTLFLIPGWLAIKSLQSGLCHGCAGWDRLGIACYGDALL